MYASECSTNHNFSIRWFSQDKLDELLALDEIVFRHPWKRDTMKDILIKSNNLCLVAESNGMTVGYLVFEIQRDRFHIIKMGVLPDEQRIGVGTALVNALQDLLTSNRCVIEIDVRESLALDGAYRFYQKCGFKGAGVEHGFFKLFAEDSEDPYHVEAAIKFVCNKNVA